MQDTLNILLIGFGKHTRRVYYPIFRQDGPNYGFRMGCIVDLEEKRTDIQSFLNAHNDFELGLCCFRADHWQHIKGPAPSGP